MTSQSLTEKEQIVSCGCISTVEPMTWDRGLVCQLRLCSTALFEWAALLHHS